MSDQVVPRSREGCYYNKTTKEQLYPDLECEPDKPHWDYKKGKKGWRIYPDNTYIYMENDREAEREMFRIDLDFGKTINYLGGHIANGKTLSKFILHNTDPKEGSIFTLLPDYALMSQLYEFFRGIIPPIPGGRTCKTGDKKSDLQVITVAGELSDFCHYFLNRNPDNYILLECTLAEADEPDLELEGADLLLHGKEVYYLLKHGASKEQVSTTINTSGSIWHFLAVVGMGADLIVNDSKQIDFEAVCETLNYVIGGAYDGDGYLFWENGKRIPMWTPYEFLKARNGGEMFN